MKQKLIDYATSLGFTASLVSPDFIALQHKYTDDDDVFLYLRNAKSGIQMGVETRPDVLQRNHLGGNDRTMVLDFVTVKNLKKAQKILTALPLNIFQK